MNITITRRRGTILLIYLWKTYQKALDTKFVEYIHGLCNDYITGKSDFTTQELMNLAEVMYKAQTQMDKWSSLSSEQEEIVALNAKLLILTNNLNKLIKARPKLKKKTKAKRKIMIKTGIGRRRNLKAMRRK